MPIRNNKNKIKDFISFISERHNIFRRKRRGEPKPWTEDPILQNYRFCNVFRELDTETKWIANNWRKPHADDPDLCFAMVVARLVNWHPSLYEIGYPVPWEPNHFVQVMGDRKQRKEKTFTGAYVTPASVKFKGTKAAYLAEEILSPMWRDRKSLRLINQGTLAQAYRRLMEYRGIGSFFAGQFIADLKYVEPLLSTDDWSTWAASGPGSKRGLNRVMDRDVKSRWTEPQWLRCLQELHSKIKPILPLGLRQIDAQDLQNCLCEWDKFERVRLGEGKPRNKYPGV